MKKTTPIFPILRFKVESLSHEGRGVAHYQSEQHHHKEKHGKKVFIRYALPDETVEVHMTKQHKRWEEATCIRVVDSPSMQRVKPFCPHYTHCGGCSLQHLALPAQLVHKQAVVAAHFWHLAHIQPQEWLEPIQSQRQDYRRRARIGVRYSSQTQKLQFGFRISQTNQIIDIDQCPILDRQLNQALQPLKCCLSALKTKANIGHIELAMGDSDIADNIGLLIRETAPIAIEDLVQIYQFCQQRHWRLYRQKAKQQDIDYIDDIPTGTDGKKIQKNNKDNKNNKNKKNLKNSADLIYSFEHIRYTFAMSDFTQINHLVNRQMITQALKLLQLQAGERVLDLFCGLGNFSLPMAQAVGQEGLVIGVEASQAMVKRARYNAQSNHLTNTKFFSQDLNQDFSQQNWAKQGFDAILIDPPRTGAWQVMQYIAQFGAKRILYISCDPATLARDSQVLIQQGYQLVTAGIMDMFSHTSHIETMALWRRQDT